MHHFASAVSQHPLASHAGAEVVGAVVDRVGTGPDVAIVFATPAFGGALEDLCALVAEIVRPACLLGVVSSGLLAGDQEIENGPAVALWAGHVGAVEAVRLEAVETPDGTAVLGMPDAAYDGARTLILFADPFSFPSPAFLHGLSDQYPNLQVIGGLPAGGQGAGATHFFLDGSEHRDGAVGLLLEPDVATVAVVSQGCRPIGEPFTVTRAQGNLIQELGGVAAMDRLQSIIDDADPDERRAMASSLHVGIVVNEHKTAFDAGDFLIRAVVGATREGRAVAVGDQVPVGATVQFQVRDADTAHAELLALLSGRPADSALVFSCVGRGEGLFGEPGHDARWVTEITDSGATAGMFCSGEIGPIGAKNHLHGFTSSTLLFGVDER